MLLIIITNHLKFIYYNRNKYFPNPKIASQYMAKCRRTGRRSIGDGIPPPCMQTGSGTVKYLFPAVPLRVIVIY